MRTALPSPTPSATPSAPPSPTIWRRVVVLTAVAALVAGLAVLLAHRPDTAERGVTTAGPATPSGPNPVTPQNFHGYGFDQCLAPSQAAMDAWLLHSPFQAVGIYISGDSRACRNQPNLTPTWIRTQLAQSWSLLPITLGPQASCQPRFPRYRDDFTISPKPGSDGLYRTARKMGRANAQQSVADATALGISPGSTLWYDLEGFDVTKTRCRESALAFLSGWVTQVRQSGFVSGVYSSAGSGIQQLDLARRANRRDVHLPDRIWVARWDEKPNTSTSYIAEDGWRPGNRIKQYRGGHDETWGGVRINIDSNRLELGASDLPLENHCNGTPVDFPGYIAIAPPTSGYGNKDPRVKALKCLLKERGIYDAKVNLSYTPALLDAVRAWHSRTGSTNGDVWTRRDWMSLLTYGYRPVLKFGTSGYYVRKIQRGLNAAGLGASVPVSGRFDARTQRVVKRYQKRVSLSTNGIVGPQFWALLASGTVNR